ECKQQERCIFHRIPSTTLTVSFCQPPPRPGDKQDRNVMPPIQNPQTCAAEPAQLLHSSEMASLRANKIGGIVRAAAALVARDLRMGAEGPRTFYFCRSLSLIVFRGDQPVRSDAFLDPAFQRRRDVALWIAIPDALLSEAVWADATDAVTHSRRHK